MGTYVFKLPDVGEGIAQAEIVDWHVKVGDTVKIDAPLVDVMTDKATVEISSPVAGRIVDLKGSPGAMARVGAELVVIETDGTGAKAADKTQPSADKAPPKAPAVAAATNGATQMRGTVAPAAPPDPAPAPAAARPVASTPAGKPVASPAVRARAADLGIDLASVRGSGEGGRVEHADLDALLRQGRAPARAPLPAGAVEDVPVIGLRRQIAHAMQESTRHIPHFAYVEEVDVTAVEELRAGLNERFAGERGKLTLLPFIIHGMVRAVARHGGVNAHYDEEAAIIRKYAAVHVGVATQTPRGLVVPVVRDAQGLDLWAIAAEVARLSEAARSGKATREELSGSTITVSSLGRLGGVMATPIIKPPEVAIVGVNKIADRPVVDAGGRVVVRKMMNLSSSFDHRVVDGFDAAEFIQAVRGYLESPADMFIA